jgi:hypothetical protein
VDTIILSCPRSRLLLGPTGPLTSHGVATTTTTTATATGGTR